MTQGLTLGLASRFLAGRPLKDYAAGWAHTENAHRSTPDACSIFIHLDFRSVYPKDISLYAADKTSFNEKIWKHAWQINLDY